MRLAGSALALGLAACAGVDGTYRLELRTAPGSTLLDQLDRVRLTLSVPYRQLEARRGGDGKFHLDLEVPADGPSGQVTFEGFDAAGALVGWGRTAPLPIAAVDATIAIYVAPPQSLAAAPEALDPPRTALGVGAFSFGPVLVGGATADGVPVRDLDLYDVYAHRLLAGEDLPAARAAPTVAPGGTGYAYVFGGRDSTGAATGTLWRFDTTVAPRGVWQALDDEPGIARAGAPAALIGPEVFLTTGTPPAVIDGRTVSVSPATRLPALTGTLTTVDRDDLYFVVAAGEGNGAGGVVIVDAGGSVEPTSVPTALRTGHGATATRDGVVIVLGGAVAGVPTRAAVIVDPVVESVRERADVLTTARTEAAVASNGDVILVAGGRDAAGLVLADAEVLDASSLAPIATVPLVVPRAGATAVPIGNGQLMVVGGVDAAGAPIGTIELYTPAAP